ncbi:MAG: hypothetical protein COX19_00320 [Desulfobacterales bacterium CG23_combo_of_CG06-09_8_20_14_all_51_8]|nr:MAG: hypothetical protein COX19_00320 [Desulfobacterales bacterium CG23_combo_of_CG06-09_8_20_14_all_51_8]
MWILDLRAIAIDGKTFRSSCTRFTLKKGRVSPPGLFWRKIFRRVLIDAYKEYGFYLIFTWH